MKMSEIYEQGNENSARKRENLKGKGENILGNKK